MDALEQKQTITERLLNVFPGHYGKYVSLHFGIYLNEPITTKEQQKAFDTDNMNKALQNPEKYIEDNQEVLEQYLAFQQSDEYKKSPAYKLQEFFAVFHQERGYYDIFIPAMIRLSQSYRDYHEALQRANEIFISKVQSIDINETTIVKAGFVRPTRTEHPKSESVISHARSGYIQP